MSGNLPRKLPKMKRYKKRTQAVDAVEVSLANVAEIEQLGCEVRYASESHLTLPAGALAKVVTLDGKPALLGDMLIPLGNDEFDVRPKRDFMREYEEE